MGIVIKAVTANTPARPTLIKLKNQTGAFCNEAAVMSDSERELGVIKDILLPVDPSARYDVYFTDKRIAIICMGHSNRFEEVSPRRSVLFGIAPETPANEYEQKVNRQVIEDEVAELPISEKLKLSKKSCYYTYQEIEEVKLFLAKKLKFAILSKDCVSKFSPTQEQFKQLADFLPTIEMLKEKTKIIGNITSKAPHVIGKVCGSENNADSIFCDNCGTKTKVETDASPGLTCGSCGTKNRLQASYCKRCGSPIRV